MIGFSYVSLLMLLSEQSHFIVTYFGTILYMRKDIFSSTFGSAVKI